MNSVRLRDVATVDVGLPFRSANYTQDSGDVRLLRGDNVSQGRLDWSGAARWPAAEMVEKKYEMRVDDVVLAMDRPWVAAGLKRAIVRASDVPSYLVQRVARLRAKPGVDQRFLGYVIKDRAFSEYLLSVQTGTAIPHISGAQISGYRFNLPPVHEQQAIAEVLGALDDKIAANTALATTADEVASVIVRAALTDERMPLSELAEVVMGSSPRGEDLNDSGDGLPFYQGVRDFGMRFPSCRIFTTAPVRMAAAGDLLVSVRAPVGDLNWAEEDLCIGRGLAAVRSRFGHHATLFHQLRVDKAAWQPFQSEGTVFASINKSQLHGLELRTIDSDSATQLEAKVESLESQIASLLQENRTLAATRDALLPQLMSGKLRVRDAEAMASTAGAATMSGARDER